MLRTIAFFLFLLTAGPAFAAWITLESRDDGRITRYDPDSREVTAAGILMWHEIVWPKPVGCAASGCIKTTRARNIYDCTAKATARVSSVDLDQDGLELGRLDSEPRFGVATFDTLIDRALFDAACPPPDKPKPM
jgi:hypothetical protein